MNTFRAVLESAAIGIAFAAVALHTVETLEPTAHRSISVFLGIAVGLVFMTGLTSLLLRWVS